MSSVAISDPCHWHSQFAHALLDASATCALDCDARWRESEAGLVAFLRCVEVEPAEFPARRAPGLCDDLPDGEREVDDLEADIIAFARCHSTGHSRTCGIHAGDVGHRTSPAPFYPGSSSRLPIQCRPMTSCARPLKNDAEH